MSTEETSDDILDALFAALDDLDEPEGTNSAEPGGEYGCSDLTVPNRLDPSKDFVADPGDSKGTTRIKRMIWAKSRLEAKDDQVSAQYRHSEVVTPNHLDPSIPFVSDPMDDQETVERKKRIWGKAKYALLKEMPGNGDPEIAIADPYDVTDAHKRAAAFDKESKDRMHVLLKNAFGSNLENVYRKLQPVSDPGFLGVLHDEFPIFSEVTNSAMEQVGLFWRLQEETGSKQPFRLRPMLLVGAPGMGKTAYSRCLAELLSVPFHEIQFASTTAGFVLSGTSPMWSNAKAGKVFDAVVNGRVANPVILLDEIDKMMTDPRYRPDGPLYSLLERDSATLFVDEYAGFPIDASYISWVATANEAHAIPEPILSRLDVFEVPEPNEEQARKTALSVYGKVLRTEPWGVLFEAEPGADVVSILAGLSPREASIAIGKALGRACAAGRSRVMPEDLDRTGVKRLKAGFI